MGFVFINNMGKVKRDTKTGRIIPTHGMTDMPIWNVWTYVRCRCFQKAHKAYPRYGGRGIFPCKRWDKFENFYKDMNDSYEEHVKNFGKKNTELDRKNNDKGYSKSNCRWVTTRENSRNRRNNRSLKYKGKKKLLIEWAEITGLGRVTISRRIDKYGWSVKDALEKKVGGEWLKEAIKKKARNMKSNRIITYKGKTMCLVEWSEETGIDRSTIESRIDKQKWSIKKALETPARKRKKIN